MENYYEHFFIILFPIVILIGGLCKYFYYMYAVKKFNKNYDFIESYPVDYGSKTTSTSFIVKIKYTVNGHVYFKRIRSLHYKSKKAIINDVGKSIVVYYDENDPNKAVISNDNVFLIIVLGLIFLYYFSINRKEFILFFFIKKEINI